MSVQRNNLMVITGDVEIRKLKSLSPSHAAKLVQFLDENDSWRVLMSIVPKVLPEDAQRLREGKDSWEKLYNATHIKLIENASKKDPRTPAEIFLFEWSTTGRRRSTVVHLLELLKLANLYRAADYVAMEVLQQGAVERPATGPAAKINLHELDEELDDDDNANPQVSNVTIDQNLDNSKAQNFDPCAPKLMPGGQRPPRPIQPANTTNNNYTNTGGDKGTAKIDQHNLPVVKITEPTGSIKLNNREQTGNLDLAPGVGNSSEGECTVGNIVLQSPPASSTVINDCRPNISELLNVVLSHITSGSASGSTSSLSSSTSTINSFGMLFDNGTPTNSKGNDTVHPHFSELLFAPSSKDITEEIGENRPNLSALLGGSDTDQRCDDNRPDISGLLDESETTPAFGALLRSGDVQSSNTPVFGNLMSENAKSTESEGIPAFSGLLCNNISANESFQSTSSDDD